MFSIMPLLIVAKNCPSPFLESATTITSPWSEAVNPDASGVAVAGINAIVVAAKAVASGASALLGVDVGNSNCVGVATSDATVAVSTTTGVAVATCDAVVSVGWGAVGILGVATLAAGVVLHATKNALMNSISMIRPRMILFLYYNLLSVIPKTDDHTYSYHIL